MHKLVFVILAATLVATGIPTAEAQSGSVVGTVCDHDCEGLPGATVVLRRADALGEVPALERTATTDAAGTFRFDNVPDGAYTLDVTRQGFSAATADVQVPGAAQTLRLEPEEVSVSGTVADAAGAPAAGARLHAYGSVDGWERHSAVADEEGAFSFVFLAGHRELSVDAPGFYPTYERILFDGSTANVTLERVPPQTALVQGRITDQDGSPVAGATVAAGQCCIAYAEPASPGQDSAGQASSDYYGGGNHTTSGPDGRYAIHVDPGDVYLNAYQDGYASASAHVTVGEDQTVTQDLAMRKHPEKTARLEGSVVDAAGDPLPDVHISVQSPEYGIHECSGGAEPMQASSAPGSSGAADPASPGIWPGRSCAITVDDEGRFSGMVTPGYAIVTVSHWRTCEGGSACGRDHYPSVQSLTLPADATTRLDVVLRAKPAPDAVVQGYVLEAASDAPLDARLEFNHLDTWAWGSAATDGDGSYRLRLLAGPHHVRVYAEGHLHWEGIVDAARGTTDLDVRLHPGQEAGCCFDAVASDAGAPSMGGAGTDGGPRSASEASAGEGADSLVYEDLGGGLGPYRAERGASENAPLPLVLLAALALAAARRR